MVERGEQVWKVGQLAAATGMTVRALHHYDHLGLVRPSERTAAGHRLYAQPDVERLYAVLALRQLGLPLDAIGEVLDGTLSVETVLTQHRAYLDQQLVAMRTLRAQLLTVRMQVCPAAVVLTQLLTGFGPSTGSVGRSAAGLVLHSPGVAV